MDLTMPSTKSETTPAYSWRFEAIGTSWEIASSRELLADIRQEILREIDAFDTAYSRFRPDSLLRKAAETSSAVEFPESVLKLFDFYDDLFEVTGGKVTPLVGDVLAAAGYDEHYSLQPHEKIAPIEDYSKIVQRDGSKLQLTKPVLVDIGAVGKGFLVDHLTEHLKKAGHTDFIVDGSGDMRIVGNLTEVIGLEHPHNNNEVIGTVQINNKALCASAVNRRAWGEWHHVIDPTSGRPTREVIATWVIADSAMVADGLATALFFAPPQVLAKKYNYEYLRMNANGSVEYSDYFSKGVFS